MGRNDADDNSGEHWMLKDKRATRGKRMASLVGEAEEQDEQFWGHEVWQENESDAESYSTEEEVQPDQFDSDFNDTEDDDDDDSDDGDDDREHHGKKSNSYKDPSGSRKAPSAVKASVPAKPKAPKDPTEPRAKKPRLEVQFNEGEASRSVRQSTKVKTINADIARERRDAEHKHKFKPHVEKVKATFDQDDMLREALQTEEENVRWLEARKHQQAERDLLAEKASKQSTQHKDFIRYHSSRGSYKTITFSSLEIMPKIFSDKPPTAPNKTCVITGLPAKYKDPLTQMPYATLAAFKEIRKRYA